MPAPSSSPGGCRPTMIRVLRALVSRCACRAVAYLLTGLPLGFIGACIVVFGLSLGVGLLPVALIGVPVLMVMLLATDGLCRLEQARTALFLGVTINPPAVAALTSKTWWRLRWRGFFDAQRWRQVVATLLLLPPRALGFGVAVVFYIGGLALVTLPTYNGLGVVDLGFRVHGAAELTGIAVAGVALLLIAPKAVRRTALWLAALTRVALGQSNPAAPPQPPRPRVHPAHPA